MNNKFTTGAYIAAAIVLLVAIVVITQYKNNDSQNSEMIGQEVAPQEIVPQENGAKQPVVTDTVVTDAVATKKTDRAPAQYACVGEYCDGSMAGDDYREKYTTINVPLVRDGQGIGCGAEIFFAPHAVPKTTAVLDATYKLLFNIKTNPEIPADGFRNTVGAYTKLFYDRVTLEGGVAKVYLTGEMYGPGHCAEPEMRTQMIQAALQYPTVNRVEILLNNKVYDWCAMDVSDGEGPCPEIPQLWVGQK